MSMNKKTPVRFSAQVSSTDLDSLRLPFITFQERPDVPAGSHSVRGTFPSARLRSSGGFCTFIPCASAREFLP